jgi:hypothetical protein
VGGHKGFKGSYVVKDGVKDGDKVNQFIMISASPWLRRADKQTANK